MGSTLAAGRPRPDQNGLHSSQRSSAQQRRVQQVRIALSEELRGPPAQALAHALRGSHEALGFGNFSMKITGVERQAPH
jgi:hypothetical protein